MRIVTWNVNGIRSATDKGLLDWLEREKPDLLCLQETKAQPDQLDPGLLAPKGYRSWFLSAEKKGYSGVALYAREEPAAVVLGMGKPEFDSEGRTATADFGRFAVVNCYFPNSQREHTRLPYKLAFDAAILEYCQRLRKAGKEVVLCGDFNAAHTEIDLANPKENEENAGFLPEERAWVDEILGKGYVDVFRERHPGQKGHYTWWTFRANARARNIGWRLDYFLVSKGLAGKASRVEHLTEVKGSDHCPVRLTLET